MWKGKVSITTDRMKRIADLLSEHQSERFHRLRYGYPQPRVASMVGQLNQGPIERHGAYPTHSYKLDGPSKDTVSEKTPKYQASPVSCYLELHDLLYLSALVINCYNFDTSYLGLIESRTRQGTKCKNSWRIPPPKDRENFLSTIKTTNLHDQQKSKLCHGQETANIILLETLQHHVQSKEFLHMAYSLPIWKL